MAQQARKRAQGQISLMAQAQETEVAS